MARRKRPYPVSRLVEELLAADATLASAADDVFMEVFTREARRKGYLPEDMPKVWDLHRARFNARARLSGTARKRHSPRVENLLLKARQAALEAVADYNNPLSPFRSGSFVVHMHLAWAAALLAAFLLRKVEPHYVDPATGKQEKTGGQVKWWDLAKCVSEFWKGAECAVSKNIEFFIGLRNQIEHALMPELDLEIFGECQALLINLESFLASEFGDKYALQDSLALSLQFSRLRNEEGDRAARLLHSSVAQDVRTYVDKFRSSLSSDVLVDMKYSFKVFLVPNTGNHRSKDALAVEWVTYDPSDPESAATYTRTLGLIKKQHVPVANIVLASDAPSDDHSPRTRSLRLTDDPTAPAVRIVHEDGVDRPTIVREQLADELFAAVDNILDANTLLAGRRDRFVLGAPVYYRIYGLRNGVAVTSERCALLARTALWDMRAPALFWFTSMPSVDCARTLQEAAFSVKIPQLHDVLRLFVLVGSSVLEWLCSEYQRLWGTWSQPPQQYWTLRKLASSDSSGDNRLLVLRCGRSGSIAVPGVDEVYRVESLINAPDLASDLLSRACEWLFEHPRDADTRNVCLDLDYLVYGNRVQSMGAAICADFANLVGASSRDFPLEAEESAC